MKRVISIMLADKEVARVVEGKFENLIEPKGSYVPRTVFSEWYNDCFYGIREASTFDQRFQLVQDNNYFCFSKPKLKLIARNLDD